mgnify:CR=1 FL=1
MVAVHNTMLASIVKLVLWQCGTASTTCTDGYTALSTSAVVALVLGVCMLVVFS